jgi:membrane associated rhomboid family serine protease
MVIKDDLPWGMGMRFNAILASGDETLTRAASEPVFNAPLIAVLLATSMPILYLAQSGLPDQGRALAFRPASLIEGGWWPGVVTSMFLHAGWAHALMNATAALAFAPPVARLFRGAKGVLAFLALYIVCGVLAALGQGVVDLNSDSVVVGASGAVFGLMGAALRLLGRGGDQPPRSLTDPRFLAPAAVIMAINAVVGLAGLAPGMEGVRIAWEAHAAGFVVGALSIGPWIRVFGDPVAPFDSHADVSDAAD